MLRKKGLVAKIKDNYCIIVTKEGVYKKIAVPAGGARIGMEINYYDFNFRPILKPMMLVASFLILMMGFTLFRQSGVQEAMAYVSLDINPSVELTVNKKLQVKGVTYFNNDGVNLTAQDELKDKNVYDALNILVKKAIEHNYLNPEQKNLMISTIAGEASVKNGVDMNKLQQVLEKAVASGGYKGDVRVYPVTAEVRTMAQEKGLSPGKFIVYEQLQDTGAKVSINEVKQKTLHQLVDGHKLKLLPNHKKLNIRKAKTGTPRVIIEENQAVDPSVTPSKNQIKHNEEDDDEDDDEDKEDNDRDKDKENKHDKNKNRMIDARVQKIFEKVNKENGNDRDDKKETPKKHPQSSKKRRYNREYDDEHHQSAQKDNNDHNSKRHHNDDSDNNDEKD